MQPQTTSQRRTNMLTRRDMLRSLGLLSALAAAPPLLSGCGESVARRAGPANISKGGIALANVSRSLAGVSARPSAVAAVQAFSVDLYKQLAAQSDNVVCSPYSVEVALAMTRNGAKGQTATEMDSVMRAPELERFNEGLNSLTRLVESRAGEQKRFDGSKATVSMDVANSLWGQRGMAWERPFLEALARYYGAGMRLVDYKGDAEAARLTINSWTSQQTHGKIPHLLPPNILDRLSRLVLVNAIYLKAPWEVPFDKAMTRNRPFTLADGGRISAEAMQDSMFVAITEGPGWRAARLPYAGRQIAMTVVLPSSSLAELERSLNAAMLRDMLSSAMTREVTLTLPKWSFRQASPLKDRLVALGMPTAFDPDMADFSGMTRQEALFISAVQHEAFISVDEDGTVAAAATAVMMEAGSAQYRPPPPFLVDRPFLFVIHDVETGVPLFIGRVTDPTAT